MSLEGRLSQALVVLLVLAALLMVVGQLFGQPLLLGYVTTDSMEPTISPGDGFVAIPSPVAGEPQVGDVVVFEAEEIQGGGLTTHRIVGHTDRGYVTKGDANPFTDQDGGEPHLAEGDVLAKALQVNDHVIVVPHLGTAAMALQRTLAAPFSTIGEERAGTLLVVVGGALFIAAGAMGEGRSTDRSTSRENVVKVWTVVVIVALVFTAGATLAMVAPSGTYQIEVVATDEPSDDPQVVAPGETATATYEVHNAGAIPMLVVSEPADEATTTVMPRSTSVGFGDSREVTAEMVAPAEEGEYVFEVHESRYLLLLPPTLLVALHSIHPVIAIMAIDVAIALFVVAGFVAFFGTGYLRMRPGPDVPLRIRIERKWRRLRR